MKKRFSFLAIFVALFLVFFSQLAITSCTKDKAVTVRDTTTIIDTPAVCNVQGTYTGMVAAAANASTAGQSGTQSYALGSDNLAVCYIGTPPVAVTFGGYTNTCDSVIISAYYTGNSSYYVLKGALSNNMTIISGTYQNLTTTTDFGTFSFTKQ
jgi:hypothetical protein